MDIETGYGADASAVQESVVKVLASGVVGVNIEDQLFGTTELRPTSEQTERITAVRSAAGEVPIFINARSDIFKNADPSTHNSELLDAALKRAEAYAAAGADGFFVPGLKDIELIKLLCERSPLPVNILQFGDMASSGELAAAGVARISHGPFPYLNMIEWLKAQATTALA